MSAGRDAALSFFRLLQALAGLTLGQLLMSGRAHALVGLGSPEAPPEHEPVFAFRVAAVVAMAGSGLPAALVAASGGVLASNGLALVPLVMAAIVLLLSVVPVFGVHHRAYCALVLSALGTAAGLVAFGAWVWSGGEVAAYARLLQQGDALLGPFSLGPAVPGSCLIVLGAMWTAPAIARSCTLGRLATLPER